MNCSICNSQNCNIYARLFDDRHGYPGYFNLLKCSACGHKYLKGEFSEQFLMELYTEYYPRLTTFEIDNFQPYKEVTEFEAWLDGEYSSAFRWIPRNVRILDIGCGFGETLAYHKLRGCDAYGVEADENILLVANKFGFKVNVGLFNASQYEKEFFDYVTMDQVSEHVINPVETLKDVASVLKPGGIVILSTPNCHGWGARIFGPHWINWHTPYHLHLFSKESIKIAAKHVGLVLEKAKTITSSEWLNYQWIHLLTYPEMGEPSSFWTYSEKGSNKHQIGLKLLSKIHEMKINHLITRFFDALGVGDNYLFILRKKT